ncbi:hypothetical protein ES704_01097 [subsurface metagenome]|jgi:subtilisin family serine protease
MKVKLIIISIILLLIMVFASGCLPVMEKLGLVNPTNEEQLSPEKVSSDGLVKVLIGFREKPGAAQQALVKGVGGKIKYTYHIVDAIAASIPDKAIDALQKNPNVRYVEPDGLVFALVQILPWGVDRIDAEVVHATENGGNKGTGISVAIIDTGIASHKDLYVADGESFVDYTSSYSDDNGHGTHVTGTVAAMDNDFGVVGVAPAADLYALKALDERGRGYVSDIVAAIEWAVDPNSDENTDDRLDIINMSLGGGASDTLEDACLSAYDEGLLLVAAAGNSGNPPGIGDNVGYPAAYESVIAVAATDQNDERARWSSTGPAVELAAPGVGIYSTYIDPDYATYSGTSMASPHVAGVAALVICRGVVRDEDNKYGIANEVRELLSNTAQDIGLFFNEQGNGLVDAEKAVLGTTIGDDLTPPAAGTIAGKVTEAEAGLAIAGATVVVEDTDLSADTDTDGNYVINNVAEGIYTVTASADGYENDSQENVTVSADAITSDVNFTLTLSETGKMYVSNIVMSLKKAGINVNAIAKVTIVDASKNPVGGAIVSGSWSDATSDKDSGVTDTYGEVSLQSNKVKNPSGIITFIFTVDDVIKDGWDYDPFTMPSGSIIYNPDS